MQYYILQEHYDSLVRNFNDSEKEFKQEPRDSTLLANDILYYIRFTHIRQFNLFTQKRGEEFERMMQYLEKEEHNPDAAKRYMEDDDLWETTLEFAVENG